MVNRKVLEDGCFLLLCVCEKNCNNLFLYARYTFLENIFIIILAWLKQKLKTMIGCELS